MRKLLKRSWLLAVIMIAAVMLTACGSNTGKPATPPAPPTDNTKPVDGGTLNVGTTSDIVTLNPLFSQDTASGDIQQYLFAWLYDFDAKANLEVNPWTIAKELPKVSDDKLVWTIKLKPEAKWSDGSPITAQDIAWNMNTLAIEEVGSPLYANYATMKEAKALDATTLQITLKDVDARFERNALNMQPVPAKPFEGIKPEELQNAKYGIDLKATITSGPYLWKEWVEKQDHVLELNPNWWGSQKPHIKTVVFKIYADQNVETEALVNGDIDLVETIPIAQIPVVKAQKSLHIFESAGQSYDYISWSFKGENFPGGVSPFVSAKTRQAINYAIDRKGMVDAYLQGHGTLLNGPFLPGSWADTPEVTKNYNYDKELAKKMLAEDGWKAGSDGILVKDGKKFEFDLLTNSSNPRRMAYGAVVQQNLAEIGIKVNFKPMDFSALIDQYVNDGKYQALLLGWSLVPDPDAESIFSANFFPPAGQNAGWYKNEKTDALWQKGYKVMSQADRKAVYADILKEFANDPPYVFLAQQNIMTVYSDKLHMATGDTPQHSLPYGFLFHRFNWWVTQ